MPVASDAATHVAPSAVPTASSINLPEGRTLNINVNWGENDPAKKVPVEPKRRYIKKTGRKVALTLAKYYSHITRIGSMSLITATTNQTLTQQNLRIA